ncbi:hypothetical protein Tco_0434736 [Tanacetum coccineum]
MVNGGCKADGSLKESRFDEPMPSIGIYVAGAALACGIAMTMDALHGFRYKKYWFSCKFFALNATILTLIAIAIKFSMDLNATMPHRQDQLAKVSSSAFICAVMGNLLPSLGTMKNTELFVNVVALAILVITAIANICIQMSTDIIFGLRNANHTQTLDLADIYERLVYEDNLIQKRYSDTKKALITTPSSTQISTAFFSNNVIQDFQENSDDEVDERSSEEYLRDLDIEYHKRTYGYFCYII